MRARPDAPDDSANRKLARVRSPCVSRRRSASASFHRPCRTPPPARPTRACRSQTRVPQSYYPSVSTRSVLDATPETVRLARTVRPSLCDVRPAGACARPVGRRRPARQARRVAAERLRLRYFGDCNLDCFTVERRHAQQPPKKARRSRGGFLSVRLLVHARQFSGRRLAAG